MNKKVSILIPMYNSDMYIAETLDSVLNQTYTDWECIIVDDHSADNSTSIVETYCEKYPNNFKLYTNPRKGACAARNMAFEKSCGDYIQYLDADDLLSPNKIEEQIKLFEQYGDDIIANCTWVRFYNEIDTAIPKKRLIDHDYENPVDWLIDSWMGNGMGQTSIWLTLRHIIQKVGNWNESLYKNQDGDFFCRVLLQSKSIRFCNDVLVYYRGGLSTSITSNESREKQESVLYSYSLYEKYGLEVCKTDEMKKAIATAYSFFIYVYCKNKKLCSDAYKRIQNLGMKPQLCGGKSFQKMAKILGFKLAIMIKRYIS